MKWPFLIILSLSCLHAITESFPRRANSRFSSISRNEENENFGLKNKQNLSEIHREKFETRFFERDEPTKRTMNHDRTSRRRKRNEKLGQNVTQIINQSKSRSTTTTTTTTMTPVTMNVKRDTINVTQLTDNSVDSTIFNFKRYHQDLPPSPLPLTYYGHELNDRPHRHRNQFSTHKTGDFFGQLVRLLLEIPNMKLAIFRPLIIGVADTAARVTQGAAGIKSHVAQYLPAVTDSTADIGKKLIETAGDAGTTLFNVLVQLTYGAAAAQRTAVKHLPHTLTVVQEVGQHVASALGTTVKGVADTTHVVTSGVLEAAKIKGNLVSNLINDHRRPKFKRSQQKIGGHGDKDYDDEGMKQFDLLKMEQNLVDMTRGVRVRRVRKRKNKILT